MARESQNLQECTGKVDACEHAYETSQSCAAMRMGAWRCICVHCNYDLGRLPKLQKHADIHAPRAVRLQALYS